MPGSDVIGRVGRRYIPDRKPDARSWLQSEQAIRRDEDERDWKSRDIARWLPRTSEVIANLIRDPDQALRSDPNAVQVVLGDDAIVTALDNAFLPIASATWTFKSPTPNSEKLIEPLKRIALETAPGFKQAILHLCHARLMGTSLVRPLWKATAVRVPGRNKIRHEMRPVEYTPYDKRQFAISRPEWREDSMFLIDDGMSPQLGRIYGFHKAVDRTNYIISQWRNTQDRQGYGHGLLDRLYRVAKWRKPIMHLLLQALETHAGGVRVATVKSDLGIDTAAQTKILNDVRDAFANSISLDTIAVPAGVDLQVIFPPGDMLRSIKEMVTGLLDQIVSKIINGVTLLEQTGGVGSYALGKVHAAQQHLRIQTHADFLAEELQRDHILRVLQLNPWMYEEAGIPFDTPPPILKAKVPGGHDIKEAANTTAQLLNAGVDLPAEEIYDLLGLPMPTDQMRAEGKVLEGRAEPAAASPFGADPNLLRSRMPISHRSRVSILERQRRSEESAIERDPGGQFDDDGANGDVSLQREQQALATGVALDAFNSEGFSDSEGRRWLDAGVADADTAVQWTDLGYGPADVERIERAEAIDLRGADPRAVLEAEPAISEAVGDSRVRELAGDIGVETDGNSLLVTGAKSLAIGAAITLALVSLFAVGGVLTGPAIAAAILAGVSPLISPE